jgi:hypothetical protein
MRISTHPEAKKLENGFLLLEEIVSPLGANQKTGVAAPQCPA